MYLFLLLEGKPELYTVLYNSDLWWPQGPSGEREWCTVQCTVNSVQWRQLHPVAVLLSRPCHELVLVTHSTLHWTPAPPVLLSS